MLEIRPIMNSAVEDIFAFKTCCGAKTFDQNLEILLRNTGSREIEVPSSMTLLTDQGPLAVNSLMPYGILTIGPGETRAFYCSMDPTLWSEARQISFRDTRGNSHTLNLAAAFGPGREA